MGYKLTDIEYAATRRLPADERYDYFVSKVVAAGEVWSLKGADGWVVMSSEDGEECLPVWPHKDFAAAWATGDWSDCAPAAVALDVWLQRWTPGMEKDGTLLAVFPADEHEGVVTKPAELQQSIEREIATSSGRAQ